MINLKIALSGSLVAALCLGVISPQTALSHSIQNHIVEIENSSGEGFELEVDQNDRFIDVLDKIQAYFQTENCNEIQINSSYQTFSESKEASHLVAWNLSVFHAAPHAEIAVRAKQEFKRDYGRPVTNSEKEDITFIVTTLGFEPWHSIGRNTSSLKKAGDKIRHIHPFHFLEYVFSEDKLIAAFSAIQHREVPKVKKEFFGGLKDTLQEEAGKDNLLPFVSDFAKNLGISKKKISSLLENEKYDDFFHALIELKPRDGADRHIM